jgi:hypothetical protein
MGQIYVYIYSLKEKKLIQDGYLVSTMLLVVRVGSNYAKLVGLPQEASRSLVKRAVGVTRALQKKTPIPSTAPLVLNLLATLGHILHLDASSLWLLRLCFFGVPFHGNSRILKWRYCTI